MYSKLKNLSINLRKFVCHDKKYASVMIEEHYDYYLIEAFFTSKIHEKNVTAVHIHSNVNGSPGQIIAWLLTSSQWQHGVLQQTPGKNSPCCNTFNGSNCVLAAPPGTSMIHHIKPNIKYNFKIPRTYCDSCPGITKHSPFGFLVIHGNNFQTVSNGCLSYGKPQLDVLMATPLIQV